MKNCYHPAPCGCGSRVPPEKRPPLPCREDPPRCPPERPVCPVPPACGGYLMQRIIASGRLHRRRACVPVSLAALPEQDAPPYTVMEVCVCAPPRWEEIPSRRCDSLLLRVTVPLNVRVRDGCGNLYCVSSDITEELCLRCDCPPAECWRGQPYVQAAVRLAGRACPCECECCEIPLEIFMEGYILCPSTWGQEHRPACPPSRPWYPEPIYDPYNR